MIESIVIVGAGQCGATAALTLRETGFGGRIVLIGDEPIAPYERPPLSKAVLCDEVPRPAWVVPLERYAEMDVEHFARNLRGGRLRAISPSGARATYGRGWLECSSRRARLATFRAERAPGGRRGDW